ncbi:hypothetical protein E6C76_08645 [Pseudothauera nasutitermitis]|uniref:Uncharacterized protein n=1 Tax=Pseudothauera nasutitermitis TaxID=2565930 RepID=A0A4S4AZL3_9RHOO|nr:hypothetical protein [Pseudothauera nasutitermitis]THF65628.1 hypothetical protein E6C76_08645 [Pseudothauera nasutitermitis]
MRGKIVHYSADAGTGVVFADGRQFDFSIRHWRHESAPQLNRTVELTFDGETLTALAPVGEDVLLKEKAAALKERLGGAGQLMGSAGQLIGSNGGELGRRTLAAVGLPVLIGYAVFLVGSLWFQRQMSAVTLLGWGSVLLLLLAYVSLLAPVFLPDRRAPLAWLAPLAVSVLLALSVWVAFPSQGERDRFDAMNTGLIVSEMKGLAAEFSQAGQGARNLFGDLLPGGNLSRSTNNMIMRAYPQEYEEAVTRFLIKSAIAALLTLGAAIGLGVAGLRRARRA